MAQQNQVNHYGNLGWIADSIQNLPFYRANGVRMIEQTRPFSPAIRDSIAALQDVLDTNAISRLDYEIGTNANQNFTAWLVRPLQNGQDLKFGFRRSSYPGWMTSSFARNTFLTAGYGIRQRRISFDLDASTSLRDLEMNAGLRGDNYTISEEGSGFGLLVSDIYLDEAFQRDFDADVEARFAYYFVQRSKQKLAIELDVDNWYSKFKFQDDDPDSGFYAPRVTVDSNIARIVDSNLINTLTTQAGFMYRAGNDSALNFFLQGRIGHQYIYSQSNGFSNNDQNLFVAARSGVQKDAITLSGGVKFFFAGYNIGDLNVGSRLQIGKRRSDRDAQDTTYSGFTAKVRFAASEPLMVFERYDLTSGPILNGLKKVKSLRSELSYSYGFKHAFLMANLKYQSLIDWVYFDSNMVVNQHSAQNILISPGLKLGYWSSYIRVVVGGAYQFTDESKIYSLPRWVSNGEASVRFPMFKKKIWLQGGAGFRYYYRYYARGYLPTVDQFFVQAERPYGDYFQVDPFLRAQIGTVHIEVRYRNLSYGYVTNDPLIAPNYPMVPGFMQFKVAWRFKN